MAIVVGMAADRLNEVVVVAPDADEDEEELVDDFEEEPVAVAAAVEEELSTTPFISFDTLWRNSFRKLFALSELDGTLDSTGDEEVELDAGAGEADCVGAAAVAPAATTAGS